MSDVRMCSQILAGKEGLQQNWSCKRFADTQSEHQLQHEIQHFSGEKVVLVFPLWEVFFHLDDCQVSLQ